MTIKDAAFISRSEIWCCSMIQNPKGAREAPVAMNVSTRLIDAAQGRLCVQSNSSLGGRKISLKSCSRRNLLRCRSG